jgi:hypothetical protein
VGVVVFAVGTPANAVPLSETLTDLNSTASYSANTQVGSNAIQVSWVVDGVSQLFEQNFYIDLTGTTNNVPTNLANVAPTQFIASNTNFNPGNDKLVVKWADIGGSGITVQVDFGLTGFPAGTMLSDIAETISITNSSDSAQAIRFFQYVDFDLDGTGAGDTASSSTSPVKSVLQTGEGSSVSETVVTPGPSLYQVGDTTIDTAVIEVGKDLSTEPTTQSSFGPGDAAWAFQWNKTIASGGAFAISKDKNIRVPEPATLGLLGVGLVWLGFAARRRREAA